MRCLAGELQMSSGYHSAVTSSILKNSEGSPGGFCWGVREMTWPPAPLDVAACRRVRVAAWCLANQGVLNTEPACWLGKAQLCGAVWYISEGLLPCEITALPDVVLLLFTVEYLTLPQIQFWPWCEVGLLHTPLPPPPSGTFMESKISHPEATPLLLFSSFGCRLKNSFPHLSWVEILAFYSGPFSLARTQRLRDVNRWNGRDNAHLGDAGLSLSAQARENLAFERPYSKEPSLSHLRLVGIQG